MKTIENIDQWEELEKQEDRKKASPNYRSLPVKSTDPTPTLSNKELDDIYSKMLESSVKATPGQDPEFYVYVPTTPTHMNQPDYTAVSKFLYDTVISGVASMRGQGYETLGAIAKERINDAVKYALTGPLPEPHEVFALLNGKSPADPRAVRALEVAPYEGQLLPAAIIRLAVAMPDIPSGESNGQLPLDPSPVVPDPEPDDGDDGDDGDDDQPVEPAEPTKTTPPHPGDIDFDDPEPDGDEDEPVEVPSTPEGIPAE